MADLEALQRLRDERFFDGWDEFVTPTHVADAEDSVRRLVDDLIALGPDLGEDAARRAVDECVCRFNDLDEDGWFNTIEREGIYEQVGRVVDLFGFDYDEDWAQERDW